MGSATRRSSRGGSISVGWYLSDLRGGGAQENPLLLGPALRESTLVLVLLRNRIEIRIPPDAPRIEALSAGGTNLVRASPLLSVRALRAARRFDVLVGGLEFAPTIVAAACGALLRTPVVSCVRADLRRFYADEQVQPGFWRAQRLALRLSSAVVVNSDDVRASLLEFGVPAEKLHVLPNPVRPIPAEHTAHDGPARLLTVAYLKPQKGLDTVLDAAALLRDVPFVWHVLGSGDEEARLRRRAVELGLADRVRFEGFVPDPDPWYASADLFVLTSRVEGFSRALVEAMAAGLPSVSTRCGADLDRRLRGAGTLVPVGDAPAMASAIRALLADPERSRRMGETARRKAECYEPGLVAEQYDALFAAVAGRGQQH